MTHPGAARATRAAGFGCAILFSAALICACGGGGGAAPAPSSSNSNSPPQPPVVNMTSATAGTGLGAKRLAWSGATGATSYNIDLVGSAGASAFTLAMASALTASQADLRIPAWWDATDKLRVTACNSFGCTAETSGGNAVGTPPSRLALGIADTGNAGASLALSADGLTLVVGRGTSATATTPLRVYARTALTDAWSSPTALAPPAGNNGVLGSFGLSISGDGTRLVTGDPNANTPYGKAWVIFDPASASPAALSIPLPAGLGSTPSPGFGMATALSRDGRTMVVLSPYASGNSSKAWAYDLSSVTRSSVTTPAPTALVIPAGLAVSNASRVALSANGGVAVITGTSASGATAGAAAFATIDLASGQGWVTVARAVPTGSQSLDSISVAMSQDGSTVVLGSVYTDSISSAAQVAAPFTCATQVPRTCTSSSSSALSSTTGAIGSNQWLALTGSGRVLAVGTPAASGGAGQVAVFLKTDAGAWVQAFTDTAPSGVTSLGKALALADDLSLVVGAPGGGGTVYLY